MKELINTKIQLYQYCMEYVQGRIDSFKKAMNEAQEAANEESKSSAGDKYETGRAMMQLERDKNARQLAEALQLQKVLHQIQPQKENLQVTLGSLVFTNKGNYYIAISAGKIELDREIYYAIAANTPLALKLNNLKLNEEVLFNSQLYTIEKLI